MAYTFDYTIPHITKIQLRNKWKATILTLKKARKRRYPAETNIDAVCVDEQLLLANTLARAESLLVQAARGIGLYVNSDKIKFLCFNQDCVISVNDNPLKLIDQFIYFGINISSTESNVNIRSGKTWIVTDKLSTIWKSDLSDRIKRILSRLIHVIKTELLHHLDFNKRAGEKAWYQQPTKQQLYGHLLPI